MAYVSHLPQLVSSALMRHVDAAVGARGLESAGRGLDDATRLASSPGEIWEGIFASNADFVGEAASQLAADLSKLSAGLANADDVQRLFAEARTARQKWQAAREAR
jgi:prephenate dehydrogenase